MENTYAPFINVVAGHSLILDTGTAWIVKASGENEMGFYEKILETSVITSVIPKYNGEVRDKEEIQKFIDNLGIAVKRMMEEYGLPNLEGDADFEVWIKNFNTIYEEKKESSEEVEKYVKLMESVGSDYKRAWMMYKFVKWHPSTDQSGFLKSLHKN